jgi:tetratricopeptide (TPR) repeat protein
MADQLLVAWLDWIEAECAAGPVLVVLEDLHWADPSSLQFVEAALRTVRDRPLMVVGLARPEVQERFPAVFGEHNLVTMRLAGLSRKASERLVHEVLGDRIGPEERGHLAERADGNPFYLEELMRAVDAGGGDALASGLPVTVIGMVHARLDALGEEARHVLRAASVFGAEFSGDCVRALLDGRASREDVTNWLTVLSEREMIHARHRGDTRGAFAFRHAILREAAYALLTDADRALCHRLAGEWLGGAGGETQAIVVAEHFERGLAPDRAAIWYRKAAVQALEGNDMAGVISCAERGIANGASGEERGELSWMIADARAWRGEDNETLLAAAEAMRLLSEGSTGWLRTAGALLIAQRAKHQAGEAEATANRMLDACAKTPCEPAGAIGLAIAAHALFADGLGSGATGRMLALLEQVHEQHPDALLLAAWTYAVRAHWELAVGEPARALTALELMAEAFRRAGDLRGVGLASANLGVALADLGEFERAEQALCESMEIGRRLGLRTEYESAVNLAHVSLCLERFADAERMGRLALGLAEKRGDVRTIGYIRCILVRALLATGRGEEAEREARAAVDASGPLSPHRPFALATWSSSLRALGRSEEALSRSSAALEALQSTGSTCEATFVRLVHAELLDASGRRVEAMAVLGAVVDHVVSRAAAIRDPALRESFLERVPDNARTLDRARAWGVTPRSRAPTPHSTLDVRSVEHNESDFRS